jgi:hypothetical protein
MSNNVASHRWVLGHWSGNEFIETGPAPRRPEPAPDPEPGAPNCWLAGGDFFQGNRTFTPDSGKFNCKGDLVFLMALSRAEPGSEIEAFVQRAGRNIPVFHPIHELGPEDKKRLARLKRSPYEPTAAQLEDREKMRHVLLEHLAALG